MNGPQTTIMNPEVPNDDGKVFTFDYSYWSHDGSMDDGNGYWTKDPSHPNASKFADQVGPTLHCFMLSHRVLSYTPVTPISFLLHPSERAQIVCKLPECSTNYLNVV